MIRFYGIENEEIGLECFGIKATEANIRKLFRAMVSAGAVVENPTEHVAAKLLISVMERFDADKSETIDMDEFRAGVKQFNSELPDGEKIAADSDVEIDKLFRELDLDGNGILDKEEFAQFLVRFARTLSSSLYL